MNLKKTRIHKGFTLIETLVGVLLTALAASAFLLGITQAKINLKSIQVKDRAHQELKVYTENLKSLIAAGVENVGNDPPGGSPVTLISDPGTGQPLIEGNLHKIIRKASDSGDYSMYYFIHTWITWPESKKLFAQKIENSTFDYEKLEFKTYQVRLNL